MASWIDDKNLVCRVLKSFREILFSEENLKRSETRLDPGKADLVFQMYHLWWECGRQALRDSGVDPTVLQDGVFLPTLVFDRWGLDPDFVEYFDYMRTKGRPKPDGLKVGDKRPDVELVAMETKERVLLSQLHLNEKKLLVIVDCGALRKLHTDFCEQAEFLFIYTREAHEKEGFNIGSVLSCLSQHKNIEDRIEAARMLIGFDSHNQTFTTDIGDNNRVRMLADDMANTFITAYSGYPVRAFIIQKDIVKFIGSTMVAQMENPMKIVTDEVREWLDEN